MKKIIFVLLFTALVVVSVFAEPQYEIKTVPVSVAFDIAIDKAGLKADSLGINFDITNEKDILNNQTKTELNLGGKLGFLYSFKNDSNVTGFYATGLIGAAFNSSPKTALNAGITMDFHVVDGTLKANFGFVGEFTMAIYQWEPEGLEEIGDTKLDGAVLSVMPKYIFVNETGTVPFKTEFSVKPVIATYSGNNL